MTNEERISAFAALGSEIKRVLSGNPATESGKALLTELSSLYLSNGWFTEENIRHRLSVIAGNLGKNALEKWMSEYAIGEEKRKKIVVIMAGNIPLAGFDDFRCVLLSGNDFTGRLASDDKRLPVLLAGMLVEMEPRFAERIVFHEGILKEADAVIATGSNNSSRYFEHYFSKFPNIIRRNRNSVAVLTGNETEAELKELGEDVFRYFGLGCRNVTKLFVPEKYDFGAFFRAIVDWGEVMCNNKKYMNNYEYHRTLFLLNSEKLLDNNFLLLKQDVGISSPPGVLYYEFYADKNEVENRLRADRELIQCVVDGNGTAFGCAQLTGLSDFADNIDVMDFLIPLS
ncbi:MAG TPA: acyl-CoA reductase [Bacteroidia bacterium]|nr:acyl-CoA reductase [Bacteroidia bacterium]